MWKIALFLLFFSTTAAAQQVEEPLRPLTVGIYISPPFVMEEEGRYTGMAVELWEQLAAKEGLQSEYVPMSTVKELVQGLESGKLDIALTNLTITQDRAERIDFTHPWFDAGLRIMVDKDHTAGFLEILSGLKDSGHLKVYFWLAAVILLTTLGFTLFDRKFDKEFPRRWRDGLAESFYSVMSIATSGQLQRKNLFGWIGRIWEALWLAVGIGVFSYITASVTSVMTSLSLSNQIHSLRDLPGKTVAVFEGSVAEDYTHRSALSSISYKDIDEAVTALLAGRVDAIVADSPVLKYYAYTHPEKPVAVVGPIFEPDKYGFGLKRHSPLTRPLSVEIIGLYEDGQIKKMREKYFGKR